MGDADRPVEVHRIVGACLFCGIEALGTPENPPVPGSPVICGGCAGLHVLEAELVDDEWVPHLRKPGAFERTELLRRDDVRDVRAAYMLDQMEGRMAASSAKRKRPSPPRTGARVRLGPNRLEAKGPDAR